MQNKLAHITLTVLHILVGLSLSKLHLDVEVCCAYLLFICNRIPYICSVQSENLHNIEIGLHILRIPRLSKQSRACATHVRNLEIA